jgi:hypothetical protein
MPSPVPVYRYERKFLVEDLSVEQVVSVIRLHPALFAPLYRPRWVNNIYFDDRDLGSLRSNVDGTAWREKLRIRWYGELFGRIENPTLELKIKRGLLGTKRPYALDAFAFDRDFEQEMLGRSIRNGGTLPEDMRRRFADVQPVLINRYHRCYFRSADGRFRITVDTRQKFLPVRARGNTFLPRCSNANDVVLELKYAQEHDEEAAAVTNHFPFRLTKSSKYVSGMLATRG